MFFVNEVAYLNITVEQLPAISLPSLKVWLFF